MSHSSSFLCHHPTDPSSASLLGLAFFSSPSSTSSSSSSSSPSSSFSLHNLSHNITLAHVASPIRLISGGGAGHEPSHSGYVGPGMLSGAVSGRIFSSPSPNQILALIEAQATQPHVAQIDLKNPAKATVLMIVKNYTGDRLNFGIAQERARARGHVVSMVIVGDDAALPRTKRSAGRRGLCGTLFVHKIAGALADLRNSDTSLNDVTLVAQWVADHVVTVGVALVTKDDKRQLEIGLGIHGEPGFASLPGGPDDSRPEQVVAKVLETLLDSRPEIRGYLQPAPKAGDALAVIVNNLGGLSELELGVLGHETLKQLLAKGFKVRRAYRGALMTSLNMTGFSISLLHLEHAPVDLVPLLDHPVHVPAWPSTCFNGDLHPSLADFELTPPPNNNPSPAPKGSEQPPRTPEKVLFRQCLQRAMEELVKAESRLTEFDLQVGDGDCGKTIEAGALSILAHLDSFPFGSPRDLFLRLSELVQESMGGSSGALYSLFLDAAAVSFGDKATSQTSLPDWSRALSVSSEALSRCGGAHEGDRTMIDALFPALKALQAHPDSVSHAVEAMKQAAVKGAEATVTMEARAGRSSYIAGNRLTAPDPGAVAVAIWISAVAEVILTSLSSS